MLLCRNIVNIFNFITEILLAEYKTNYFHL